jgi:hypothetical protein
MQCVRHIAPCHVDLEAWCPAREATLIGINFGMEMALEILTTVMAARHDDHVL